MTDLIEPNIEAISQETYRLIKSISRAMAASAPSGYEIVLEEHLKAGMIALSLHKNGYFPSKKPLSLPGWKERLAKELMSAGMSRNISVSEVAKACSLSRSHFSRAFKHTTGVSPKDWALQIKVKRTEELLSNSTLSLSDISQECGFSDQSHLSRTFLKHTGMTPSACRSAAQASSQQSS